MVTVIADVVAVITSVVAVIVDVVAVIADAVAVTSDVAADVVMPGGFVLMGRALRRRPTPPRQAHWLSKNHNS